jgi:hypothetical protein
LKYESSVSFRWFFIALHCVYAVVSHRATNLCLAYDKIRMLWQNITFTYYLISYGFKNKLWYIYIISYRSLICYFFIAFEGLSDSNISFVHRLESQAITLFFTKATVAIYKYEIRTILEQFKDKKTKVTARLTGTQTIEFVERIRMRPARKWNRYIRRDTRLPPAQNRIWFEIRYESIVMQWIY